MRRIFVLFFILAACLVVAPAALAAPKACDTGQTWFDFGLKGSVTAVDAENGALTVAVEQGSEGLPASVDVLVTEDTHLFRVQHHDRTCIDLADIVAGDEVMILGWTDDSSGEVVYTAAAVSVKAPCFGLVGTVTAVDAEDGLLTVSVDEATGDLTGEIQIVVTDETRIVRAHRYQAHHARGCDGEEEQLTLADVAAGDTVGVWGTVDKSGDEPVYTADRVSVQVPRFGLVGSVTEVNTDGGALFVAIDHASGDLTGTIEVAITGDTELFRLADHEKTAITLADVAEGDVVAVFGTIDLSTGESVYTAHVVLDGVSADMLPKPSCKPGDAAVKPGDAQKGDRLKLRIKVADAMPGCPSARVTLKIKSASGRTVASRTVAGVKVNTSVTVAVKLGKTLHRGTYRVVATSRDWAGNRQAKARAAVLTVK
jgi:5-hydroxyisourate hydrolase-like protein (transthyretin family)